MYIGINCFEDVEIRTIISSIGEKGTCDLTGEKNVYIYDTEHVLEDYDLKAYFLEIIDIYTPESMLPFGFPSENLKLIEEILVSDWSIFSVPKEYVKRIIVAICKSEYPEDSKIFTERIGLEKLCDSDFLRRNCLTRESTWEKFTSSIKSINRFHSNHINLDLLKTFFESPIMQKVIAKGDTEFYRARISDENGLKKSEMGPPPMGLITAGRANSQGIRCLYLSNDEITTIHEIRARDFDYISIGNFRAKQKLQIVDLSNLDKISPFSMDVFSAEWFSINMSILKKISREIAKPLRRQDSDLDYLPSQYIADYIKSLGYDGICYRSTLNKEGVNYAIFDSKKFECIEVDLVHIDSVKYEITAKD
ncbi:MAG: RES family NAD+ phosphorylase [Lachnospiraceae bacterium]|nr:RES family NAD+ phosphorylase [Lachnospiraceae bacterium]